jgi:hypothetical protein
MVFHARITLANVHKEPARAIIGIGDTIVIEKDGTPKFMTSNIQKRYNDISYSLDDDEEPAPKKVESQKPKQSAPAKQKEEPKKTEKAKKKKQSSEE